jgi:hypothetical protein
MNGKFRMANSGLTVRQDTPKDGAANSGFDAVIHLARRTQCAMKITLRPLAGLPVMRALRPAWFALAA